MSALKSPVFRYTREGRYPRPRTSSPVTSGVGPGLRRGDELFSIAI